MGFINNIRSFFGLQKREEVAGGSSIPSPRTGEGYPWLSFHADPMSIATVYRCVNLLADSVANLPLYYKRLKNGIFVNDDASTLNYLLNVQPDYCMSAVDFWRQVVQYMLLRGNAYIVPVVDTLSASAQYSRLVLVNPDEVSYDVNSDTYTINSISSAISGVFRENEIIHIKNQTRDGKRGLSTISYAATVLSVARTGDEETLDRFENGGRVRGIVGNDTSSVKGFGEYQDKQLKQAAEDLDEKFSKGKNIVHLPGAVTFQPITMTSTDLQFLETRKFSVREICRFFGVHPSFVFDDTSNNYKSAEMANVAFLSNTLNPLLRKIENEFMRKLVAMSLCDKRQFSFDRSSLYACDLETRIKYQSQMLGAGIVTVNELRAMENRPAIEGGDKALVSANLKSINELTQPQEEQIIDNNGEE